MIAFVEMAVTPCKNAGIPVPNDLENYDKKLFNRFFVYCAVQLGASMPRPNSHFTNAELIASLDDNEVETITYQQLLDRGLEIGHSSIYS